MSINRHTNKEALLQARACTQTQWTNSTMRKKEICHLQQRGWTLGHFTLKCNWPDGERQILLHDIT